MREHLVGDAAESHRQLPATSAGTRGGAQPTPPDGADSPVRDAIPSSTRVDCSSDRRAALEGAYLLEDRAATRSFVSSGPQEAVPGSAAELMESARAGPAGRVDAAPPSTLGTVRPAAFGGRSPTNHRVRNEEFAAQPGSWPVTRPLATEVGICGQIGGNPLVIQRYLATMSRAEMLRKPCLRGVMRSRCPLPW